ncbi:hypothetical protein PG994_001471 [Apiospora phragmitis]|uniref:Uncharacterized protein n=1 Tax=Apiospora phragmitis TaxID=2905665 RepID=A0ABR1WTK9_9PEZI
MTLTPTPLNLAALGCIISGSCASGTPPPMTPLFTPCAFSTQAVKYNNTKLIPATTGIGASASLLTMPALLRPDVPQDALLHQWHSMYRRGAVMPALAGATTLGYWAVAYSCYRRCLSLSPLGLELGVSSSAPEWRGFAAAGALTLAIVPFTFAAMMPTIHTLEAAMDGAEGGERKKTMGRGTAEALAEEVDAVERGPLLDPLARGGMRCMEFAWLEWERRWGGTQATTNLFIKVVDKCTRRPQLEGQSTHKIASTIV